MNEGPATPESFWKRSATRNAIGTTYIVALSFVHKYVAAQYGEGFATVFDAVAAAWGLAFGINAISPIQKP